MKIAFWSNSYEQARVSYNLAAISITSVMRYPYSIAVLENNLHKNNLGLAYLGSDRVNLIHEAGNNYYDGGGIEGLLRKIYRGDNSPALLKPYLKEIIRHHLYYIPQSRFINNEIFDYEFSLNADVLFRLVEEAFDLCYIDTTPLNMNSKNILETADLIVVNLCQNKTYIDDFFENYSSLIPKAVFLIGNYSTQSCLNYRTIAKEYEIPLELLTPIPRSEAFESAYRSGRTVEFITGSYHSLKEHPEYFFIQSVRRAATMIIKRALTRGRFSKKELEPCGR